MDVIRLGAFELRPSERTLWAGDRQVELRGKAFDLLLVLAENPGRLVTKATLLERVWPRLVVDENNLPTQIASLRRVLGAQAIRTVPGYGYRLDLDVSRGDAQAGTARAVDVPALPVAADGAGQPIPRHRALPLIGRDDDLRDLEASLSRSGLVTIVGGAGVGKSRIAAELLCRARNGSQLRCAFVALSALASAAEVPPNVALALGVPLTEGAAVSDGFEALIRVVGQSACLIVLDGAEHLAGALAAPVAMLLERCPDLRLLITSQIPLGAAGEIVYRLDALGFSVAGPGTAEAGTPPAVQLFAQRAEAADRSFHLTAANATQVAEICRRLDGNPLALELAAARVPTLGVGGLLERLDDRFRLLRQSGRSGDSRHGTLAAAFAWSYGLLGADEQRVFRRLGAFAGSFALDAAIAAVHDAGTDEVDAVDLIGRLVDRSLATLLPGAVPRYVLSETARQYAIDRLAQTGELDEARARMAQAMLGRMDHAYEQYWVMDEALWVQRYAPDLESVRSAIDWCIGHQRGIAIALYGSTWPLFVEAELHAEARSRFDQTVGLLVDRVQRKRLSRYWEAVATYDSTRQWDRARYAAELAATHAESHDLPARYYALMLLALNSRDDRDAGQAALSAARALEDAAWPPRLLTHGALTESALLVGAGDLAGAREAARWAVRLALNVSERQALAATVRIVELDLASGDTHAALQLGRPLADSLRHSGRGITRIDVLILNVTASVLAGELAQARAMAADLHALALRLDQGRLYAVLDAMALLACEGGAYETAARVASHSDLAYERHGMRERQPTDARIRGCVMQHLERSLGADWRAVAARGERIANEAAACALVLGLPT